MQPRHPPPSDQSTHPALLPQIPLQAINSLIPRLTTTINDIDAFKSLLAAGNADGSMPNWDAILQRYSLLLGRINALSTYLSQPTPNPPGVRPPRPSSISTQPALSRFIVHPINVLPTDVNPLAPDAFFQVINTQPLPAVSSAQSALLSSDPWVPLDRLKKMDETSLEQMKGGLRDRLGREHNKAQALREEIGRREEDLDWGMRIDAGEEEGGMGGSDDAEAEVDEAGDEDLFGDDEVQVVGDEMKLDAKVDGDKVDPMTQSKTDGDGVRNVRGGWILKDYVRFMETGRMPETLHGVAETS
ncbi:MAG: hypothetical protein TREMPRED_000512 [Tremellales sp. Tagirdzhanova-0007]|nr:MAG: hypothetical protein TREMPRED_000512 [Tremellales sp. Tagirdzhanova-0007]